MLLGNKIRSLRDEQGILQRQVAAYLEIDTPMFCKIERGDWQAKRNQVTQMATYFKVDEKEMLTLWLADKILDDRIDYYLVNGEYVVILEEPPLSKRDDYVEF